MLSFLHEKIDYRIGCEEVNSRHADDEGQRDFHGKGQCFFHTGNVSAGIVITDQRHDTLGETLRNIHRNHIDFLRDSHGGDSISAKGGGEIVENGHACYI